MRICYLVWKNYQRRAEVLSSQLEAELKFMPHLFRPKFMRWADYVLKTAATIRWLLAERPDLLIFQAPPLVPAICAILLRIPYAVDAHNAMFQSFWKNVPLSRLIMRGASAVIVHNYEVLQLAEESFRAARFINIPDPVEPILAGSGERRKNQILVICSFGSDEPVDTIIEVIQKLPDFYFIITADTRKLSEQQQAELFLCKNVNLPGFLTKQTYHEVLCSSSAALVLTDRPATQPSGACEALASDTPLIISKTTLISELFGAWAILVENAPGSIIEAIQSLRAEEKDWAIYREQWNSFVADQISAFEKQIAN